MQVDRLIITAQARTVPSPFSSAALVARVADGTGGSPDRILLATGPVGAGEQYIQAAEALRRHGCVGIIAQAFAWPFFRLCLNIGLPPLTLWEAGEIRTGDRLRIDLPSRIVKSLSAGTRYPIRDLSDVAIEVLACGGMEGYVRARLAAQASPRG